MKICIDCDPGVDDSLAILFALARPDVEVVGISTSVGNVTAKQGADNALRILKLAGMEHKIPVCVGAEQPLNEMRLISRNLFMGKMESVMLNYHHPIKNLLIWMYVIFCIRLLLKMKANWC